MYNNKISYLLKKGSMSFSRFLPTFLDNCGVYTLKKAPSRGPLFVVWNITNECNLQCSFCGCWKGEDGSYRRRSRLSLAEKKDMVNNLADAGVWYLSLCGGEPLLCEDLEVIVMTAKSRGMVVNVSTNGLLLKERAVSLGESGLDFLTISIDGHDRQLLDQVRGRHGLFDRIMDGIEAVHDLPRGKRMFLEARYIINKSNYRYMGDFVGKFDGLVDSIVFKPIYKNSNVLYDVPDDMALVQADEEDFLYHFNKFLSDHKRFNTAYNRQIPVFLFHPEKLKGRYLCFAGTFFCGLGENGDIFPCHEMAFGDNKSFGSLSRVQFIELWRSDSMKRIRSLFRDGNTCSCWMDRFLLNLPLQRVLRPGYDKA